MAISRLSCDIFKKIGEEKKLSKSFYGYFMTKKILLPLRSGGGGKALMALGRLSTDFIHMDAFFYCKILLRNVTFHNVLSIYSVLVHSKGIILLDVISYGQDFGELDFLRFNFVYRIHCKYELLEQQQL